MGAKSIGFIVGVVAMLAGAPARAVGLDPNFLEGGGYATTTDDADLTSLAWAPDGSQRLFVTRKSGQVYVIENRVRTPDPFYDFTPVFTSSECGVLAIAFDPDYGTNHFVYFFVTMHEDEQQIIRLRDDGNVGVDRTTILAGLPTRGVNHDGGALGFGPDGKLYWAIGDNGDSASVLGDMSTLKSKIGRANRDGTLPTDNPFDDGSGPNNDFIWARNFRNPFTMTFQPDTGRLWLDVVGTYFEQVFTVRAGDDGGWPQYEYNAPSGVLRPVVKYRTNGADGVDDIHTITSASRAAGVATFTVTPNPYIVLGEEITIAGVGNSSFNGVFHIDEIVGSTGFRVTQPGPDATSNGGTMTLTHIGGCITGGTFLDSTAASAEYRGNFFFGDFNTGNIERVRVDGDRVLSITRFSVGHGSIVDIDTGPDGGLYWVRHDGNGEVYRAVFASTAQGLVVSHANVRMLERGVAAFNVHLAMAPSAPVEVSVARASGDRDVTVTEGQTLEFGTADWATPKVVRLAAAGDVDGTDDVAELSVSAGSLSPERVTVRVVDEYRAPDVGEGGAGGEAGAGGAPEGGAGAGPEGGTAGNAGTGTGGTRGLGGSAGRAEGGQAGLGEAGQGTSASGGGGKKSGSDSSSGCGCAVSHRSGGSALLLVLASFFLRRRLRLRR